MSGSAMGLLMESIRLQDELSVLRGELPPAPTLLERTADALDWQEATGAEEARSIWERLKQPATVEQILNGSSYCHYHKRLSPRTRSFWLPCWSSWG
jgi:hypothetical protein